MGVLFVEDGENVALGQLLHWTLGTGLHLRCIWLRHLTPSPLVLHSPLFLQTLGLWFLNVVLSLQLSALVQVLVGSVL